MVSYVLFLYVTVILLLCCYDNLFCSARDTLTHGDQLVDDGSERSETLISAGGEFELGFFPTSAGKRYVGIWYHKVTPRTVVWVANRKEPLPAHVIGVLRIEKGKLCLFDRVTGYSGKPYWSTEFEKASPFNKTVKILDSGNLVLSNTGELTAVPLWQSFQDPTDTFLPGMVMDTNLELTSWTAEDDPRPGNYTFKLEDPGGNLFAVFKNKAYAYWKSGEPGKFLSSDKMRPDVAYLLLHYGKNDPHGKGYHNYTRLVMNSTGVLKGLIWNDTIKQWEVFFSEPKDQCNVFNACGDFGSCSIDNSPLVCKCLPGFQPQNIDKWKSGDFSGGCTRQSSICGKEDTFLTMKMNISGSPDSQASVIDETECKNLCLGDCPCQACAYSGSNATVPRDNQAGICYIWTKSLNNLVEDSGDHGEILNARVSLSGLESTVRDCENCGTTTLPYPLTTESAGCGDPLYLSFLCNTSINAFSFLRTHNTSFRVINISRSTQRFIIKSESIDYCDHKNRVLNIPFPFKVISWCNPDLMRNLNSSRFSSTGASVIEMGWEPPSEPTCTTSKDCRDWPNSSCNPVRGGWRKCLCNTNFQWNGINLNCTQEGNLQGVSDKGSRKKLLLYLLVAAVISGIFLACIIGFCIWRRKMTKRQDQVGRPQLDSERRVKELIDTSDFNEEDDKGIDVPFFDLQSILDATDNFSITNKLGQGGYGPVYKGIFPGGQEIAVKRLSKVSGQGLQEFKNEVVLIAKLQHRNLVRLRGYCMRGEEKILLYEYMPNKSLDSFIFDHAQSVFLNWEMRFNIILGIARGLLYLHQDSRLRIIHRDLKTSNILLDDEMNPKISDFGLARIVGGKESEANTNTVVGTYGYMSPEYALDGNFSIKSDVFSFGVVLLEIISGKKNAGFYQSKQTFSLLSYTWGLWTEDKVLDIMDKNLEESCNRTQFIKCVNVGLLCVQEDPVDRPTMSNVVTLLDSETAIPAIPKQPAFFLRRGNSSTASSSTKPDIISEITTLEGR